jgi:hypothetical protein
VFQSSYEHAAAQRSRLERRAQEIDTAAAGRVGGGARERVWRPIGLIDETDARHPDALDRQRRPSIERWIPHHKTAHSTSTGRFGEADTKVLWTTEPRAGIVYTANQ